MKSAERFVRRPVFVPPFENGERMDQPTFHALYKTCPPRFKAELIGGVVHVPSPTSSRHGRQHIRMTYWVGMYLEETPGTDGLDNTTNILAGDSETQPDVMLRIDPESGGQTQNTADDYVSGPPELVIEVAVSSAGVDLNTKKRDYERYGVREYVVVLVNDRRVVWFARGRKGFTELRPGPDGLLRSKVFPGLWLDPAGVFERSPHRVSAAVRAGLASPEHAAFVAKLEAKARKAKGKPARPAEDDR